VNEAAPEAPDTTEDQPQPAPEKQEAEELSKDEAVKRGYSKAQREIRERHKAEFLEIQKAEVARLGHPDWTPTPSKEEKAEQDFLKLLAEHPHLVDKATDLANRAKITTVSSVTEH
jgi:hypothetical protein